MATSIPAGGIVVVTHLHPAPQGALPVGTTPFSKGHPLVLGTVQIMVGLMVLLFGIVMSIWGISLGVYSGVFAWGALLYIIAGSLTVAAGKTNNRCLVNGSLGVSIAAAVASFTAVCLYGVDTAGIMIYCYGSDQDFYTCDIYRGLIQGSSGVLFLFHLLVLLVSITVAVYGCRTSCCCCDSPQVQSHVVFQPEPRQLDLSQPPMYSNVVAANHPVLPSWPENLTKD